MYLQWGDDVKKGCFEWKDFQIKDTSLLKYLKSISLPSLSLSRSGIFCNFKKLASFLGNPVHNECLTTETDDSEIKLYALQKNLNDYNVYDSLY